MKKLSKIVALLLAGAMAMLMFTACSGGGGGSEDKAAEEKVMSQIRGKSTSAASLQNEKTCRRSLQPIWMRISRVVSASLVMN